MRSCSSFAGTKRKLVRKLKKVFEIKTNLIHLLSAPAIRKPFPSLQDDVEERTIMFVDNSHMLHHDVVDKQVAELHQRMRLLQQDRRANIDLLETAKVSNSTEVRSLKEENKKLRTRLSNLQKTAALDNDKNRNVVETVKKLVLQKRNEYDMHKSLLINQSISLNKLKDEANICRMEDTRPAHDDGPLSRQIRLLENRLDNAMIQYNEAQGICSTYDHIVKRLKEERVGFDNQLTAMELTLQSKQRDLEELVLLSGDANHARDLALQNLQKEKSTYEDSKNDRARNIRDRQQHLRIQKQLIAKQEKSDIERASIISNRTDGAYPGEFTSTSKMASLDPTRCRHIQQQIDDQESTLNIYEEAFRKIKDATGVSDVNEVIRKVTGQESTTENLLSLTAQNQTKIEELTSTRESLSRDVDKVKYKASESSNVTKNVDEQSEILNSATILCERAKSQYDRLSLVLMSIKAGIEHIWDKFHDLPVDFNVNRVISVHSLSDNIRSSGDILVDMHRKAQENEIVRNHNDHLRATDESNQNVSRGASLHDRRPTTSGATEERPFNQRIALPSAKEPSAFDQESDGETVFAELDGEEEISREGVKRASSIIIATEERRRPRSKKSEDLY